MPLEDVENSNRCLYKKTCGAKFIFTVGLQNTDSAVFVSKSICLKYEHMIDCKNFTL